MLRAGLRGRLLLAGGALALWAGPAVAEPARALSAAEATGLANVLGCLSLAAFSAGLLVGWNRGRRGWIWGMSVAAGFEVVLAGLMPADWGIVRPWLPFLIVGALAMLGLGGLGGWVGSRARR